MIGAPDPVNEAFWPVKVRGIRAVTGACLDGFVSEGGGVSFLDGDMEGAAVHVGDGGGEGFGVGDYAGAERAGGEGCEAVAAEGRHRGRVAREGAGGEGLPVWGDL